MTKKLTYAYTGSALQKKATFKVNGKKHYLDVYLSSDELKNAVNLAIQLQRPLLLMGEPGCGKTRLAEAVAYELHGDLMHKHYFRWNIKSTSQAKDGIYKYDALKRLYDVNLKLAEDKDKVSNVENYIAQGKLVRAFTQPKNGDLPNVLLIDEIDKANIDFPNDLLLELDEKTFEIEELETSQPPKTHQDTLVIITSNQEKALPAAFLRRCLYHYIDFPEKQMLKKIVQEHTANLSDEVVSKAIKIFSEQIRENLSEGDKKPSTSELIEWLQMIDHYTALKNDPEATPSQAEQALIDELEKLEQFETKEGNYLTMEKIPYRQILFKTPSALYKLKNAQHYE